jgi:hypothetical protein
VPRASGNRHVVTVRGHLEKERSCIKKAEALSSVTERIVAVSKRHRIRSPYCFSPEVNDDKSGWLRLPLIQWRFWQAVCPRRSCVSIFSKDAMLKSSTQQRSLHTLAQHLMAQLLSLQEPCLVKMALKRRHQYEFD